ncbi:hypothetical protein N7475_003648 [Penicillium sp. IBT 31633x]|nr:hypothetical protein N7475_003648 [Penicillium sp. IBT 31633x]
MDGATSETQRGPSVSILFDVPRQIQTTKTKAMNSSSSRLMQEFEQSRRKILHAHAAAAAGAASLWLLARRQSGMSARDFYPTTISFIVSYDTSWRLNLKQFLVMQGASVGSKIAGQGDPQAHNLRCRYRAPFKRGEE